jgi:hypothetical protein
MEMPNDEHTIHRHHNRAGEETNNRKKEREPTKEGRRKMLDEMR